MVSPTNSSRSNPACLALVLWLDIDYMVDHQIFTFDETRYPLDEFRDLINNHSEMILIVTLISMLISRFEVSPYC